MLDWIILLINNDLRLLTVDKSTWENTTIEGYLTYERYIQLNYWIIVYSEKDWAFFCFWFHILLLQPFTVMITITIIIIIYHVQGFENFLFQGFISFYFIKLRSLDWKDQEMEKKKLRWWREEKDRVLRRERVMVNMI